MLICSSSRAKLLENPGWESLKLSNIGHNEGGVVVVAAVPGAGEDSGSEFGRFPISGKLGGKGPFPQAINDAVTAEEKSVSLPERM